MSYTFNGSMKRITLSAGTTTLNLVDLHSRWKEWVLAGHAECLVAFRAVGGDIPAIPLYLFLQNSWRIVPQAADHTLTVAGGILEVEGGGDPFVDPAGSYKIRINREAPGIAIGYSTTGGTSEAPTTDQIAAAVRSELAIELARLTKLAALSAIDATLVVTPTRRTAGALEQSISTVGDTTTVQTI